MKALMVGITRLGVLCIALLLLGCDGAQLPQVIATYPRSDSGPTEAVVTEVELTLEVHDTARAANEVMELANIYRGSVLGESYWRDRRGKNASLTLMLPVVELDGFYSNLLSVGQLVSERTVQNRSAGARHAGVAIVLHEPVVQHDASWNPTRTLAKAFSVFTRLFQLLVDGAIWIVVVGGPFVLMVVGLQALLRRARQTRS